MVSGLLCWRDSHPLEWQLASLNGVAGFAAGGSSSDRKRSRPIRAFSATPRDGQRPCRTLAEDPGRTQPRAAYPGAAAQTRLVSMAGIRLGSWESARARLVSPAQASLRRSWPTPELRIPDAAAQTRIVSKARIRLDSCKSVRSFKGIFCHDIFEFESFSIGAGLCQALSDCSVDLMWEVTRRVLASLRDRHLGPPMMGSGGCGGPIYKGVLAVRLTAGIRTRNGLAS